MQTAEIEIHEVAMIFPEMSTEDLGELADDIRENGLRESIWTYDGKLIDGRNRLKACGIAEVEPEFREWKGTGSLVDFVLGMNLRRRHLTLSQRAAVAVDIKKLLSDEIKLEMHSQPKNDDTHKGTPLANLPKAKLKRTSRRNARSEAAESAGVSSRLVGSAEAVKKESPETFEQVKRGEKTLEKAKRELGLVTPKSTGKCKLNGHLIDDPPDIAHKRVTGQIPLGAIPEIDDPGDSTTLADVTEEFEERAAISDDELSDNDWLARFSIREKLEGTQLKTFDEDALLFRKIEPFRNTFGRQLASMLKSARRKGPWHWRTSSFLKTDGPEKWIICPATTDGGCNGKGTVMFMGDCPKCRTKGYLLNR